MKKILKTCIFGLISIAILLFLYKQLDSVGTSSEITYTDFMEMSEHGDIEKVIIRGDTLIIYPYDSNDYYITEYIENKEFIDYMREQEIIVDKESQESSSFLSIVSALISIAFPFILLFIMVRMFSQVNSGSSNEGLNNIFSTGKNKSKLYRENDTGVKFDDVAGQDEAKESLKEIIDYLHNAEKYNTIGAKLPKGALLVGPPGTGKTLLAKAVAGEAGVPFFSVTGSNFVEMFVGVGASRVRDLFEEAKKNAPCIIFIDEIDAIGKNRGSGSRASNNDEREQTLNQLLTEMDGFDSSKAIVVLGATNRPEILDKALLRPGRFDRRVIVDRPDLKGREAILNVHIKDVCIDESVDIRAIANATAGAVGADLANMINEAALRAVKFGRNAVSQEDLMESVETVIAGKEKKDRVMSEKEKKIVAYHEVGHAVVAALQKNSSPVQKITIVPRTMGSLGYTMQVPEEERYLSSKEEMLEEIRTLIGGRCAEETFFNVVTTGASNDIEKVTDLARKMITVYGMSDTFDMVAFEIMGNYYLDNESFRNCSQETSSIIDNEMVKIVRKCHKEVQKMINDNKELIHEVANFLLEKENITGEEFMQIFRKYHESAMDIPNIAADNVGITSSPKEIKADSYSIHEEKQENSLCDNTTTEVYEKVEVVEKVEDIKEEDLIEKIPQDNIPSEPIPEEPLNTYEEPIPFDEIIDGNFSVESAFIPEEEPPAPDFDFPFDKPEDNLKKEIDNSSKVDVSKKTEDSKEEKSDTNQTDTKPAFSAPKPLQKKGKKKNKGGNNIETSNTTNSSNQNNKQDNKNKQTTSAEQNNQQKNHKAENKESDMDLLIKGLQKNPQELAQRRKKGIYIDSPSAELQNKSNVLNPDSKVEDVKNNSDKEEPSEDDY